MPSETGKLNESEGEKRRDKYKKKVGNENRKGKRRVGELDGLY